MKKQQTLLHHFSSGATRPTLHNDNVTRQTARAQPVANSVNRNNLIEEFDDDDMLLAACQDWEEHTLAHPPNKGGVDGRGQGFRSSSGVVPGQPLRQPCVQQSPCATQSEDLPGFDVSAGNIWIYPTNYPLREYQYNIVQRALFKNTMVTLPTGLGKTFVAAVVMYNFFRWYPEGKVIFMAPTKPLVAQQIEACYNVMGIPQADMSEMTGNMPPVERKKAWQRFRVFFLTPQVLMNDLSRRACPTQQVKCLVVDEAHKALGNHAYCQVVRELFKYSSEFRVLALSATPGSDIKAVQQVLTNLLISHVEIRSEESIDIQPYVHERKVEKVVVPLDDLMKSFRDQYLRILSVYIGRLTRCGALHNQDPASLSKFQILKSREAFRQDPPSHVKATGPIEGDFALSISLYHGFELLLQHGLRSLYNFLQSTIDGAKGFSRTRQELMRNGEFVRLMDALRDKFGEEEAGSLNRSHLFSSPGTSRVKEVKAYVTSHPKMAKLQEIVLQHFKDFAAVLENETSDNPSTSEQKLQPKPKSTRVMIFAQYRDSVNEIAEMLDRHRPLLRCMGFVGQASAGKNSKGISQKEQLRVVKEFRSGGYNTLVSTCVGEEGLDIGDVDLIVCYDAHKSPIRLVQRMGRTGRKRKGRIVMLVTEGKEAAVYDRSQYNKKGIHKALQGNAKSLQLYPNSPRMVPRGINPQPHKMNISVKEFMNKKEAKRTSSSVAKRNGAAGIDTLLLKANRFKKRGEFLSAEELAYWSANYKLDAVESASFPSMPDSGHFATLAAKKDKKPSKRKRHRPEMSLTEWSPWQMNKQAIRFVEHSQRCNHFVELMEFIDLQNLTEGEDIYGLEMQTYLDEDDILRPKRGGIERFCTRVEQNVGIETARSESRQSLSSDEDTVSGPKEGEAVTKKAGRQKSIKRRKSLELLSSPSDSDQTEDTLPDVLKEQDVNEVSKIPKHGTMSDSTNVDTAKMNKPRKHKQKSKHLKPVLQSSDDDDFTNGNKQDKFPGGRQSVSPGDGKAPIERDFTLNAASKDKLNDVQKSRTTDHEYETPEPMDVDSDTTPVSPTFGKVSQSSQAAAPSRRIIETDDDLSILFLSFPHFPNTTLGNHNEDISVIRPGAGKSTIPPPPPSLSSLDLLDDLDNTVNLTQHFKNVSNFFSSGKNPNEHPAKLTSGEDPLYVEDVSNPKTSNTISMKDELSDSVKLGSDDSQSKPSVPDVADDIKHTKKNEQENHVGIEPYFDLNVDFTIISSSDDEHEIVEKPKSYKNRSTDNDAHITPDPVNEVANVNDNTESDMNSPQAFDIQTPQVESILFGTDAGTTQKAIPDISSVPSPRGFEQDEGVHPYSQKVLSNRQSLPHRNQKISSVTPETPRSGLDPGTKPRPAGQLIRDGPALTGGHNIGSRRELNLLEPYKSTSFLPDDDTAEIERLRLQVLGSSEPKFDLGFDLDSLEEDEVEEDGVLPPSPDMQQQQEYINLSQAAAHIEQPCSSLSRRMSRFWTRASSTPVLKIKSDSGSISCNELVSPIAKFKQGKCNTVPDKKISVTPPKILLHDRRMSASPTQTLCQQPQLSTLPISRTNNLAEAHCPPRAKFTASRNLSRTKSHPIIGKRKCSPISKQMDENSTGVKRRKSTPVEFTLKSPTRPLAVDLHVREIDDEDVQMIPSPELEVIDLDEDDDEDEKGAAQIPESEVRAVLASSRHRDVDTNDGDDFSQAVQHKRRRKAVVLKSPTLFKTPNKPRDMSYKKYTNIRPVVTSSDDELESPLIRRPKRRRQIVSSMMGIDEDDEDFINHNSSKKSVPETKKSSSAERRQLKNRLKKKTKRARPATNDAQDFLAVEVEVSADEECSSDEEGSELDNSLEGFINNATQASQASQSVLEHSDMHAVYMQSVRSPHGGQIHPARNRFKMVQHNTAQDDLEIFSQAPIQDESYYENSFIVREGEEEEVFDRGGGKQERDRRRREDDDDECLFENTINPDNIVSSKRRSRKKGMSKAAQILKQGRRKVLKTSSSSVSTEDAEEESRTQNKRTLPMGKRKHGQKAQSYPLTTSSRHVEASAWNTTGKRDKQTSLSDPTDPFTSQTSKTKQNVQNQFKKDDARKYALNQGIALHAKSKAYIQGNMNSGQSQGSAIGQSFEGYKTQVNSCPNDLAKQKRAIHVQQRSPIKSNSEPVMRVNDGLTLAEKDKAERLKRQEEKKRDFLRKLEERKRLQQQQQQQQQQLLKTSEERSQQQHQNRHTPKDKKLSSTLSNSVGLHTYKTQMTETWGSSERFQKSDISTSSSTSSLCRPSQMSSRMSNQSTVLKGQHMRDFSQGGQAKSAQTNKKPSPASLQLRSPPVSPRSLQMTSKTTLAGSQDELNRGKPVILVDSKELSSSSHIVSTLALRHNLNPIVSQLSGCDYIVSTRMGVEKKSMSDFGSSANKNKLIDRIRHLCELFDRPCLILEKDRVKVSDAKKPKPLIRTKYLDSTLAALSKTHIKVLYSDSLEDTARILADLVRIEVRKSSALAPPPTMDSVQEQVFQFYLSLPRVSYATAQSLMTAFPCVQQLVNCSQGQLEQRAKLSPARSAEILSFLKHRFDEQMTSLATSR